MPVYAGRAALEDDDAARVVCEARGVCEARVGGERERVSGDDRVARERLGFKALLITRGKYGMMLLGEDGVPLNIEAVGSHDAVDVTGAGDTVIAAYALALASGASFHDAARLANHAGGLVVLKRGTACVYSRELVASVQQEGV